MKVKINYYAQIRKNAGTGFEEVDVPDGLNLSDVLKGIEHGDEFHDILFDGEGEFRSMIMPVVNGESAFPAQVVNDGDEISLFAPISGG